jgi:cell division septation protein DedD
VGANVPRSGKSQTEAAAPAAPPAGGETTRAPAVTPSAAPPPVAAQPAEASAPPPADAAPQPPQPEPPPQPTTQPARETAPPPPAVENTPGAYWQVGAFKQAAQAQPIFQTLKDGGMPVILRPGPDGLVHVLAGPFPDTQSLSKAKTELETRFGIPNPVRK